MCDICAGTAAAECGAECERRDELLLSMTLMGTSSCSARIGIGSGCAGAADADFCSFCAFCLPERDLGCAFALLGLRRPLSDAKLLNGAGKRRKPAKNRHNDESTSQQSIAAAKRKKPSIFGNFRFYLAIAMMRIVLT